MEQSLNWLDNVLMPSSSHCAPQPAPLPQDASTPLDQPAAGQPLKDPPSLQSDEGICHEAGHVLVERESAATSEGCSREGQVEKGSAGAASSSPEHGEFDQHCCTTREALHGGDAQLAKNRKVWTFQILDLVMKHASQPSERRCSNSFAWYHFWCGQHIA